MILLAADGRLQVVLSEDVIEEVERNLKRKAPAALPAWHDLLTILTPEMVPSPAPDVIQAAARYTEPKDAPIIAAAMVSDCPYVVTYDQKHLLLRPEVAEESGLQIVTPDVVVRLVRG